MPFAFIRFVGRERQTLAHGISNGKRQGLVMGACHGTKSVKIPVTLQRKSLFQSMRPPLLAMSHAFARLSKCSRYQRCI